MLARAIVGLLALLAVIAVAFFWPAGTIDDWRGWLYLADFGIGTLLITAYLVRRDPALLARRLDAGPTAEREPLQRALSAVANLAFLLVYWIAGLDVRRGWSAIARPTSVLADAAVALGFAIVFFTFRANSFAAATIQVAGDQHVVDRGPYAAVRHPMYAGAFLLLVATPVALGSWWAMLAVVPLCAAIVARLLDEERYLRRHLAGYANYMARVRARLIPFVW